MWQRIQTIYLLLALVLTIVCLCLPVAYLTASGMGGDYVMTNLWIAAPQGTRDLTVWPLFVVLLLTCPITVFTIFLYKKRKLQARLCIINALLAMVWVVLYAFYVYTASLANGIEGFKVAFPASLPVMALISYLLARRGILKDEELVRAADRLR